MKYDAGHLQRNAGQRGEPAGIDIKLAQPGAEIVAAVKFTQGVLVERCCGQRPH